ncbi:MAG: phosphate ABC transporter permease PstA [Candidatus Dormibacteria bacterium]
MTRNRRRLLATKMWRGAIYLTALLALIPLTLILLEVVSKGLPAVSHAEFFLNTERPVGIPGAGISHALVGTLIMVGMASVVAVPVGVVAGIYLVEYGAGRWADYIRLASDVLVGMPSIALGLFAYAVFVVPTHQHSAYSAAIALAVLMLPVVIRTTESAVNLIPGNLRESGLALGLPRWQVALQLILPAAAPGVLTGALLAIARASGETAPLLFTTFGNAFFNADPGKQMSSLTLVVFKDALTPFQQLQDQAWGAALTLVVVVLILNLASRFVLRRQIQRAAQIG